VERGEAELGLDADAVEERAAEGHDAGDDGHDGPDVAGVEGTAFQDGEDSPAGEGHDCRREEDRAGVDVHPAALLGFQGDAGERREDRPHGERGGDGHADHSQPAATGNPDRPRVVRSRLEAIVAVTRSG
jgi:hypothetical protein